MPKNPFLDLTRIETNLSSDFYMGDISVIEPKPDNAGFHTRKLSHVLDCPEFFGFVIHDDRILPSGPHGLSGFH